MIRLKLNCISGRQISTLCLGITQKTRGLLLVGRRCFGVRSRNTLIATGEKNNLQQLVKLALWCYWHYRSKNWLVLLRSWIILPAGLTTKEADSGDRIVGLSGSKLIYFLFVFLCTPLCFFVSLEMLALPAHAGISLRPSMPNSCKYKKYVSCLKCNWTAVFFSAVFCR